MWQTLALGALLFPGLFALCVRSLGRIAPAWSLKERILLSGRLVSSVQATMATLSGVIVILSCKDVVHDRHWLASEYVWIVVAYMVYDIYVMYLCHWHKSQEQGPATRKHSLVSIQSFLRREKLMVTHHLFIIIVLTPVAVHLRGELGDFFVGCIYTAELSTPFVSLGKILMQGQPVQTRHTAHFPEVSLHGHERRGPDDHVPPATPEKTIAVVEQMKPLKRLFKQATAEGDDGPPRGAPSCPALQDQA